MASRAQDYVDIHGRNLNAMLSDDGTLYIPLKHLVKAGFHAYPSASFDPKLLKKSMVLSEFRAYMLGAAKDYLLRNSVNIFTSDEILETIEMCRQELLKDGVIETPKGVLGRTLLQNPVEVQQEVRSALHNKPHGSVSSMQDYQKLDLNKHSSLRASNSSLESSRGSLSNGSYKANNSHNQKMSPGGLNARLKLNNNFNKTNNGYETDAKPSQNYDNYDKIKLQRTFQSIKVVHIDKSYDKFKYWVQLEENENIIIDIIEKCQEFADGAPIMTPRMGEIYMANSKEDQLWYRCVVTRITPALKVNFIDFGNDEVVKEVRQLPHAVRKMTAQAVRITVSADTPKELQLEEVYSVKAIREYPDQTILVQLDLDQVNKGAKQQPILIDCIKYSTTLVNNEVVKILGFKDGKFYLRNKNNHDLLRKIDEKIREMPPVKQLDKVVKNQLVLCKKDEEEVLCRAVVRSIEGNQITVEYVDFYATVQYNDTLYAINKEIAEFPAALIESPVLRGYEPGKINDVVTSRIRSESENKTKFNVVLGLEFDLVYYNDKVSLSETLFPIDLALRAPKACPKAGKSYEKFSMDNLTNYEAPVGTNTYIMTHIIDMTEFTLAPTDDDSMALIAECTCIDVEDTEPYEPEDTEMILACFEGDWYRGAAAFKSDDGKWTVYFVDYGNTAEVTVDEIRKFPDNLRNIPIMSICCQLNVPKTEAINKKFMELLKQNADCTVNIISHNLEEQTYVVEIPKFTEVLRREKLI